MDSPHLKSNNISWICEKNDFGEWLMIHLFSFLILESVNINFFVFKFIHGISSFGNIDFDESQKGKCTSPFPSSQVNKAKDRFVVAGIRQRQSQNNKSLVSGLAHSLPKSWPSGRRCGFNWAKLLTLSFLGAETPLLISIGRI